MYFNNLKSLQKTISNDAKTRNDSVVRLNSISLGKRDNVYINGDAYKTTDTFHSHLAQKLDIPMVYYRKMLNEDKSLLQYNVNTWLSKQDYETKVLLRSYEKLEESKYSFLNWRSKTKTARGILSNRYKIMDNYELLDDLQYLIDDYEVKKCYHDDQITQIKLLFPKIKGQVKVGDEVQAGLSFRNSELGFSSISVTAFIYRLVCENGMMLPNTLAISKKYHIGKPIENINYSLPEDLITEIFNMFQELQSPALFNNALEKLKHSSKQKFKKVNYKTLRRDYNTTSSEEEKIKENLEKDEDFTHYGLIQAVTATAREIKNIQRSIHLEKLGGKLLSCTPTQWKTLVA
tara:strand:+ start:16601 stop:17641 length:1041 start_codon:yes stop_codon:yes gene_type:complete